mmetsp:Transcript_3819/g.15505  ORF Transcript_3819/g.15505 Transcript_3819/m.15505 type:complete len:241 (-) Transcript_3819:770-1492(-)
MPLPCVCINLAASLRAAPASTSRPVKGASQVRAGTMTVRAFRLDELGGSRSRRAATSKRAAKLNRDLIESPSRRVGRTSKDGINGRRQGAGVGDRVIETSAVRDAKSPLLGILDDLGDRVSRPAPPNESKPDVVDDGARFSKKKDGSFAAKTAPPVDTRSVLRDGDILEAIGTRGRSPSCPVGGSLVPSSEKLTLDLLAVPDGRANGARKTPPRRSPGRGKQARDALDLLSGPGRRTGRN